MSYLCALLNMSNKKLTDLEEDVLEEIESKASMIRLQFTDILGVAKSVTIPVSQAEKAFRDGVYFDGSSINGFVRIQESDMRLKPDAETYEVLSWEEDVAHLICDVHDPSEGEVFDGDPRKVLKDQLDRAEEHGYEMYAGPEPEFFVFESDDGKPTTKTHDAGGYFDFAPKDEATGLRRDVIQHLDNMGFNVEASHHEVAEGQHEIDFEYADGLKTADNISTFRSTVRAVAHNHGLHATFMPKPIAHINGSGMHTHLSLFEDGENAFHDGSDEYNLSETGYHFLAGLLEHAPALTAVCNPTVNSYKRLVPGYEAPVYVAWSEVNRSALIRKPAARNPESTRVEIRSPDPSCNPYLALAVILRAGLDGIEKELECPDPVLENIYEFDEETREEHGIETLPSNLGEAVDALEQDDVIADALGDHVYENFVQAKREEYKEYIAEVSDWELDNYLDKY